jgi:hypothetical protein
MQFANDIVSAYSMLMRIADLEKQYEGAGTNNNQPGSEKSPTIINAPAAPKSDSKGKK